MANEMLSPVNLMQVFVALLGGVFIFSRLLSVYSPLQRIVWLLSSVSIAVFSFVAITEGLTAFATKAILREKMPFSTCFAVGLCGGLFTSLCLRSLFLTIVFGLMQGVGLLHFSWRYLPTGQAFYN